jgi:hypothetical protein
MRHTSVQNSNARRQHSFSQVPSIHMQRSSFNRSHGYKTTMNEGYLIPFFCDEVLPGDTHKLDLTALVRMNTPIFPIMDNLYLETFFFFVPNRLVWVNWERFNGQQDNPTDSTDYIIPVLNAPSGGWLESSIPDYFGWPTKVDNLSYNVLPLRGLNLIYNEWFRDENVADSLVVQTDDGPDDNDNYSLFRRFKVRDYFTSALPWPQKINDGTVVEIPLGISAPVSRSANAPAWSVYNALTQSGEVSSTGFETTVDIRAGFSSSAHEVSFDPNGGLYADLSQATAATINQLRQAFQLQVLFERDARGGSRYTEIIRSHFNVISADQRLQRPEFLGGGSQMISVNPVTQNAPPTATQDTPQGNLAAFVVGHAHGHGFTKSFTEHGYIIGLCQVRADLNYQQGINRMYIRNSRYDFYWPALAHIGEQTILNEELYAQGTSADKDVFGYQERYAEYRYKPSTISGLFRSNATGTIDAWHLAQNFGSLPLLNSSFLQENAPMDRVEAVPSAPDFWMDCFFNLMSARPMPLYGDPMSLGRF